MSRRRALLRGFLLVVLVTQFAGVGDCWQPGVPTLPCTPAFYSIAPGTSTPLLNPCGVPWAVQDQFRLCSPTPGLSVKSTRNRGTVTRELIADPALPCGETVVSYWYSTGPDWGEETLTVEVKDVLAVTATASPDTIAPGGTSLLSAVAAGCLGGNSYAWTPSQSLSDPTISNPTASPTTTTTYHVTVTDANSEQAQDSVTVHVVSSGGTATACFTYSPPSPTTGQTVLLNASCSSAVGGTIVAYHWWWDWSGNPADPPSLTENAPVTEVVYELPGSYVTRLQVELATGERDDQVQTIPVSP